MTYRQLTNTAVVVAGQLVTRVALAVVRALCVHTSVHAVVGQGALVSVYRENTNTHRGCHGDASGDGRGFGVCLASLVDNNSPTQRSPLLW